MTRKHNEDWKLFEERIQNNFNAVDLREGAVQLLDLIRRVSSSADDSRWSMLANFWNELAIFLDCRNKWCTLNPGDRWRIMMSDHRSLESQDAWGCASYCYTKARVSHAAKWAARRAALTAEREQLSAPVAIPAVPETSEPAIAAIPAPKLFEFRWNPYNFLSSTVPTPVEKLNDHLTRTPNNRIW